MGFRFIHRALSPDVAPVLSLSSTERGSLLFHDLFNFIILVGASAPVAPARVFAQKPKSPGNGFKARVLRTAYRNGRKRRT